MDNLSVTEGNTCQTVDGAVVVATVEMYSTRQIAEDAGNVAISTVLRHAVRLGLSPEFELPGVRGAKLWSPEARYKLLQSIAERPTWAIQTGA